MPAHLTRRQDAARVAGQVTVRPNSGRRRSGSPTCERLDLPAGCSAYSD